MPTDADIEAAVKTAVKYTAPDTLELAFFGGSFTMIDRAQMLHFLDIARRLVKQYGLYGIRFSTRPDGIDDGIMDILEEYPVTAIELGAQSMNDSVLAAAKRGHSVADTENAARLIKKAGKELVLQMMVGMRKSTPKAELETAKALAELKPDAVRIYPVLVLSKTELESEYLQGNYTPLTLEKAVAQTCDLLSFFESENIPVIKVGLQAEEGFDSGESLVAGPYHQAFRELCEGEIYLKKIVKSLNGGNAKIICAEGELSKVKGHKKANEIRLKELYPKAHFKFETSKALKKGEIVITEA